MVKVGKPLTKNELLKGNYELGQKVAKLEIQVELLKDIMINRDLKPAESPVVLPEWIYYPYSPETGDPLPELPYTVCVLSGN